MAKRRTIVAGQFYPGQHDDCVDMINECIDEYPLTQDLPDTIVAGIVPHAGWMFSGGPAALTFSAIRQQHPKVHTFVIFGGHGESDRPPAVYDKGTWASPLGEVAIDEELADAVVESGTAVSDANVHLTEHGIEVQVPFIQYLFPGSRILPIRAWPNEMAIKAGEIVGSIIASDDERKIVCIGSTDLTHYGPGYGFVPMGTGQKGINWAFDVNDREFIDLTLKMQTRDLLAHAAQNYSACGAGAVAAAVAAAKALGKTRGELLAQTNSSRVLLKKRGEASAESVGYAAIIF